MENGFIDIKYIYLLPLRKNQNVSQVLPLFAIRTQPQCHIFRAMCSEALSTLLFLLPGHFTHPLKWDRLHIQNKLEIVLLLLQLQLFQDHSFFLKNYSSSYNVKELENWYEFLVLVCCINFNAREFPLNLTAFFHNLHRNFRNYSPVLLPFTTCAHSYILPFYHHPLRAFLLSI